MGASRVSPPHHQLLPDDWPIIAAALTQLRLYRRGLVRDTGYVIRACRLLNIRPSPSADGLSHVETRLSELLAELHEEIT